MSAKVVITSVHSVPKHFGGGLRVYLEGGKVVEFSKAQADGLLSKAIAPALSEGKEVDREALKAKASKKGKK